MRPIDKLFNIVLHIGDSERQMDGLYNDFMDFASLYSVEETCAMLVQMLADHNAHYLYSHKMETLLNYKRTLMNREMRNVH